MWSPFAGRRVTTLSGHVAPLLSVEIIENTPQIITADSEGWIKIWDARNFTCVQTIMASPDITSIACCGREHGRIVMASGRDIKTFDQEGGRYMQTGDNDPVFAVIYNKVSMTFCTAANSEVKVWSALTGKVSRVFRRLSQFEITAMCLDGRQRKLISTYAGHCLSCGV